MDESNRLIRVEDAARRLAIGRSKAYALAAAGKLPGALRIGGSIRVSERHLTEWIDRESSAGRR